jgi:hypothetical protein
LTVSADHWARGARWFLIGLSLLTLVGAGQAALGIDFGRDGHQNDPDEDFGVWQARLAGCSLVQVIRPGRPEPPQGCLTLKLAQPWKGLLKVSFLAGDGVSTHPAAKLSFAGLVEAGYQPMQCRQGRCEPSWPLRLQVSAVSHWLGDRDVAPGSGLPETQLAQGHCLIERIRIHCQASTAAGEAWNADARR